MVHTCKDCGHVFSKGLICPNCKKDNIENPKWINKVEIKNQFVDEPTDKDVLDCCNSLIPQLEKVLKSNEDFLLSGYEDMYYEFDELIDAFKDIQKSIQDGKEYIPNEYENDWADEFNHWLDELYSMGDSIIDETVGFYNQQHFLWIG